MASPRHLLASIHDVAPCFEPQIETLADLLERETGDTRFAMLVVPDFWGRSALREDRAFQAKLRAWSALGVEMFVHGWFHRDDARHRGAAGFKARHLTAGEGEFLGLSEQEALRRMTEGKALIEDVIGTTCAGFVAPAWLYDNGARAALGQSGLPLAEDHWRVWDTATQRTLARGPVITWASRSRARTASSIAFASLARNVLPALPTVRIAVHPGDVTKPSIIGSIERTLRNFSHTHRPALYGDLRSASCSSKTLPCPKNDSTTHRHEPEMGAS